MDPEVSDLVRIENPPNLSSRFKLSYGLITASTTLTASIGFNLSKYYTDYVGMNVKVFGYALLAFAIVNSINDPILGYFIDRTPHTWRKNKFTWYILLATPLLAIGIVFQIAGRETWPPFMLFLTVFLGYSLYDSGIAMFGISRGSITIDASSSDYERSLVESVSLLLQTLVGIVTFLLPTYFLTTDSTRAQAQFMFLGLGIAGLLMYSVSALFFRKTVGPISTPRPPVKISETWNLIKRMFTQKSYLLYLGIGFLIVGVQANSQSFMLYYLDHFLEMPPDVVLTVSGISLPAYLVTYLVGPFLVKKLKIKFFLLIGVLMNLLGYGGVLLGAPGIMGIMCILLFSLGGLFWFIAGLAFFGKIFDEYEEKFGKVDKGFFMGINAIFGSPAPSVAFFMFSAIVDFYGYNGLQPTQDARAKMGLRLGIGGVGVVFNLLALILVFLLPRWKSIPPEKTNL